MNNSSTSESGVSNTTQPYSPLTHHTGGTSPATPLNRAPGAPLQPMSGGGEKGVGMQTVMAIAKELLETGGHCSCQFVIQCLAPVVTVLSP